MKTKISLLILTVVAVFVSCNNIEKEKHIDNPVKVETTIITEKDVSIPIHASGKLYSKSELKLGFKTGGIIRQFYAEEGQSVKEGQVLAVLDLSEIQAQVYQTELAFDKAKREHLRAKNLYEDSVATLEQFQNSLTALEFARSNSQIAQFNLKYSRITAPSDGKILKKLAMQNEITAPGYPVLLFGSTEDDWIVRINLTDKDIFKVSEGDKAEIKFDAYPDKILNAHVSEIGKAADPYTGTYEVELKLHDPDTELASGLIAYVDVYPSKTKKLACVPVDAIIEGNGNDAWLFSVSDKNIVEKIKVKVYKITDNDLIIEPKDINGIKIITSGIANINEGDIIDPDQKLYVSGSREFKK